MSSSALLWLMMGKSSMPMATSELGMFAIENLKLNIAGEHPHPSPAQHLLCWIKAYLSHRGTFFAYKATYECMKPSVTSFSIISIYPYRKHHQL